METEFEENYSTSFTGLYLLMFLVANAEVKQKSLNSRCFQKYIYV